MKCQPISVLIKSIILYNTFDIFHYFLSKSLQIEVHTYHNSISMIPELPEYPCNHPKVLRLLGYQLYLYQKATQTISRTFGWQYQWAYYNRRSHWKSTVTFRKRTGSFCQIHEDTGRLISEINFTLVLSIIKCSKSLSSTFSL